jgi:orotidine-5'-phosphate decarboxylase
VPGVGAQGGDIETISRAAIIKDFGLLINVSRSIIYASMGEDFTVQAANAASSFQRQMISFII